MMKLDFRARHVGAHSAHGDRQPEIRRIAPCCFSAMNITCLPRQELRTILTGDEKFFSLSRAIQMYSVSSPPRAYSSLRSTLPGESLAHAD